MEAMVQGDRVVLRGYVNAVDRESRMMHSERLGRFIEKVAPGSFAKALERSPAVPVLFNHDETRQLAVAGDGHTRLKEDAVGLFVETEVRDAEIADKARRKKLTGWSFAFRLRAGGEELEQRADGVTLRRLTDFDLKDVSILDIKPAYIGTSVEDVETRAEGEVVELRVFSDALEVREEQPAPEKPEEDAPGNAAMARNQYTRLKMEVIT